MRTLHRQQPEIMSSPLSVVIPAYNEGPRMLGSLLSIFSYLNDQNFESEVIVVDDGSSDNTSDVAKESFVRAGRVRTKLIRNDVNSGKGYSVRRGLLATSGRIAVFSDADLSTPIEELPKLTNSVAAGVDIAFGSRALDRRLIGIHQPWRREQGGKVFNVLVRLSTGLPFWDTQCGFKAFNMNVCRPILEGATIDRFGFDVELLFIAHLAGLKLEEIAVRWDHKEGSKISFAQDSLRMFNEVRRIRSQARAGTYDEIVDRVRQHSSPSSPELALAVTGGK